MSKPGIQCLSKCDARNSDAHINPFNSPLGIKREGYSNVAEAVRQITTRLVRAGIPSDDAAVESRAMVRHATGRTIEQQLTQFSDRLSSVEVAQLDEIATRRESREPLAYILGEKEFYGRSFNVDQRVLIPRPETELLVDLAIQFVRENPLRDPTICDIGTGSGAIAVTLSLELENASIAATDISMDALQLARVNARKLGGKVEFAVEDIANPSPDGKYHLVVSNPPYVESQRIEQLEPEVRDWEPRTALDGGPDGMSIIRLLLKSIPQLWHNDVPLVAFIEIDPPIAEQCVVTAERSIPDANIEVHRDFAGLERILVILRD